MDEERKIDIDQLRREFAERFALVIGDRLDPKNLEIIHKKTGRPKTKLSQWRNPKLPNWPDMKSFIHIVIGADVSPLWLLHGLGPKQLSFFDNPNVDKVLLFLAEADPEKLRVFVQQLEPLHAKKTASTGQERGKAPLSTVRGKNKSRD